MGFGNTNDIEIQVRLEADKAIQGLKQLEQQAANVDKKFGKASDGADDFASSLKGVGLSSAALSAAIVGIGGTVIAISAKLIKMGDALGDVQGAFEQASKQAGVLSSTLLSNLNAASKNAVSNMELMSAASRGLQFKIPAEQLADLAYAAQRFADSQGKDFIEVYQQLIQAVNTGRISTLAQFGVLENGRLVVDKFTDAQRKQIEASRGVQDILESLQKDFIDTTASIGAMINESVVLISVLKGIEGVAHIAADAIQSLKNVLPDVASGALSATLSALPGGNLLKGPLQTLSAQVTTLQALNKWLNNTTESTDKADKSTIKFGHDAKAAGKNIKNDLGGALEDFDSKLNDIFGQETFPSLREAITKAFQDVAANGGDIKASIKKIGEIFLNGVVNPDEFKKRIAIILKETQSVQDEIVDVSKAGQGAGDALSNSVAAGLDDSTQQLLDAAQTVTNIFAEIQNGSFFSKGNFASSGSQVGGLVGSIFGDSATGSQIGGILGSVAELFTSESGAGTQARKDADRFFADVFDANRLAIVVGDQVKQIGDLVFKGDTPFGGDSQFSDGSFDNFLGGLGAGVQASFKGVGAAFEELLGIADDASGQIAAVLANNVGGELNNLQLLVQATGKSFDDLHNAIVESFLDGTLSIEEAHSALVGLQQVMEVGIPGQLGAIDQAFRNFQATIADGHAGRAFADSLRDIGAEAIQLGVHTFPDLANRLVSVFGFSTTQVAAFFEALRVAGITSLQGLADAGAEAAVAIGTNFNTILAGGTPTATPAITPVSTPHFSGGGGGGGAPRSNGADTAKAQREAEQKRLLDNTYKLLTASKDYEAVLQQLNDGLITSAAAGKLINQEFKKILSTQTALTAAEAKYQKLLKAGKDTKGIANTAKEIERLKKVLEDLTETQKKNTESTKLSLDPIKNLLTDMNKLGLASKELGINVEKTTDILIEGFKGGLLSIDDVYKKIKQTQDLLGQGIPDAMGDVTQAFRNLLLGGKNGGAFSLDALGDIFAEAQQKFDAGLKPAQKAQFQSLTVDFNRTRDALQEALNAGPVGGESRGGFESRIEQLQRQFEGAKKALEDFSSIVPKAGLEDLRSYLLESFDPDTVQKFFTALGDQGIKSFDDIKNASEETLVELLGRLSELGLPFSETTDDIKNLVKGVKEVKSPLQKASDEAGKLIDPLQASVDLVNQFLSGASQLPSVIEGSSPALSNVSQQITAILDDLAILQDSYDVNVTFNVSSVIDGNSQSIVDILRDAGVAVVPTGPGNDSSGGGTDRQRNRYKYLVNHGRGNTAEAKKLKGILGL